MYPKLKKLPNRPGDSGKRGGDLWIAKTVEFFKNFRPTQRPFCATARIAVLLRSLSLILCEMSFQFDADRGIIKNIVERCREGFHPQYTLEVNLRPAKPHYAWLCRCRYADRVGRSVVGYPETVCRIKAHQRCQRPRMTRHPTLLTHILTHISKSPSGRSRQDCIVVQIAPNRPIWTRNHILSHIDTSSHAGGHWFESSSLHQSNIIRTYFPSGTGSDLLFIWIL